MSRLAEWVLYCSPECYTDLYSVLALKANVLSDIELCDAGIVLIKKKEELSVLHIVQKWPICIWTGINDQEQKHCTGGKSYMCD